MYIGRYCYNILIYINIYNHVIHLLLASKRILDQYNIALCTILLVVALERGDYWDLPIVHDVNLVINNIIICTSRISVFGLCSNVIVWTMRLRFTIVVVQEQTVLITAAERHHRYVFQRWLMGRRYNNNNTIISSDETII